MTKTMSEVLAEHSLLSHERSGTYACSDPDCGWEFRYRLRMDDLKSGVDVVLSEFAAHQAAALSAAGFGLVADAGAKALEDAADELEIAPYETLDCGAVITDWRDALNVNHGIQAATRFIRGSAAAVRGES